MLTLPYGVNLNNLALASTSISINSKMYCCTNYFSIFRVTRNPTCRHGSASLPIWIHSQILMLLAGKMTMLLALYKPHPNFGYFGFWPVMVCVLCEIFVAG